MKLIGLNGRLHSGKDTAVKHITEAAAPARVQRAGFADKMKLSGVRALGWDVTDVAEAVSIADDIKEECWITIKRQRLGGSAAKIKVISGREFWQRYGTEAHRDVYGEMFHVDALLPLDSFEASFPDADVLVVTDVRFPNEAQRILDLDGEVWRIDADERLGPLPDDAHVSEQPLPPEYVTMTLFNSGTLEQFEHAVKIAYTLSANADGVWS